VKLEGLKQPPHSTTLMGVVKGALDYYGIKVSDAWAFGGSGHAFLINIHKELCPSGPYCWKYDGFTPLVRSLGLETADLGFFHKGSTPAERAAAEKELRENLDKGLACSFNNMENQLIAGYDEKGLIFLRPWECSPEVTPARLSFGSWQEFGDEVHVNFFVLRKVKPEEELKVIRDSLGYAVDLFRNPTRYSLKDYGIGPDAYDNWAKAAPEHLASHGNWWNATVWSECRKMAGAYFAEIAGKLPGIAAPAGELSAAYAEIGGLLERIADKEMPTADKVRIAGDLKRRELAAVAQVEQLLARMGG
jgi:hypothetical protein